MEFRRFVHVLGGMGIRGWLTAAGIGMLSAMIIGITTVLIPNPFFTRMLPVSALDYVFLAVASLLIGLILAIRPADPGRIGTSTAAGGIGTFFAVSCAVCNKIVLLLLGTAGSLAYFEPIQPVLGLISIVLLLAALRQRLRSGFTALAQRRKVMEVQ